MLTRVALVRHGETEWNRLGRVQGHYDLPLNARGRQQAHAAAAAVRPGDWDVVVTSPLLRASQTAGVLVERTGLEYAGVEPRLIERAYGQASGLTAGERSERFADDRVPGMESRADAADRAVSALTMLREHRDGERILAVTHGSLVKCLLLRLCPQLRPDACNVGLLTATVLEWRGPAWTVVDVGRPFDGLKS
jgi:probable phosphoglycerate mutase